MISIFSHFMDCPFTLFIVSFCAQKLCFCWFVFQKSISSIFFVVSYAFDTISKKSLPNPVSWSISPMFSSKSFIVSHLISMIPFELILVHDVRFKLRFIFCIKTSNCSSTVYWKEYPSSIDWLLGCNHIYNSPI